MVKLYTEQCEVCDKKVQKKYIQHKAGFPEREHIFCSEKCFRLFLRMEDDELEYKNFTHKKFNGKK